MKKKDTVISIKTSSTLKAKMQFIAEKEHRSMAMQIELFLTEKIQEWESNHVKTPATKKKPPKQ